MRIARLKFAAFGLLALLWSGMALADQRFPPPEFETDYKMQGIPTPPPRALALQYLDVAVLVGALGLAAWLVHRKRSRGGLIALSLFSLIYFGFYRKGCICPIGAPQNVIYSLFNPSYAVPLTALAFFVVPLVFTLFAGRTFCAAVCPHGALQDLVLLRPLKLPLWLERGLGIIPFLFLGAGLVFAATGSIFLICKFDPFVPLFRLHGPTWILLAGGALLLLGTVVGRPFCRFLCPYGALLKLASMVAQWRVRVTPDVCTQCKLCEHSCPFGAMREPTSGTADPQMLAVERRRLAWLLGLLPVLVAAGTWVGTQLAVPASRLHPTVQLAEFYLQNKKTPKQYPPQTPEILSLLRADQNSADITAEALDLRRRIGLGTTIFGGWVGLVIGAGLIGLSLRRTRTDYEPDRGACFACARCFDYCPQELLRRGVPITPPELASSPTATSAPSALGGLRAR
jgi:NosR/NirI family transcriptional regulator, nitrous oxide reductase regulator